MNPKTLQLINVTPEEFKQEIINGLLKELPAVLGKVENEELLTREQTAALLDINLKTLGEWTKKKKFPSYGMGSRVYYKRAEVISSLTTL